MRAIRRAERQHFKSERERAINEAAAKADEVFRTEGKLPEIPAEHISTTVRAKIALQKQKRNAAVVGEEEEEEESNALLSDLGTKSNDTTEVVVEDMEHLQLTLQEAFFLSWALNCLEILQPSTVRFKLYFSVKSYRGKIYLLLNSKRGYTYLRKTPGEHF